MRRCWRVGEFVQDDYFLRITNGWLDYDKIWSKAQPKICEGWGGF